MSTQALSFEESKNGWNVENRYYKIKLAKDGSIHSWRDKRTKNFEREICRSENRLNKLSIH
jgi:alpha-mannosidase